MRCAERVGGGSWKLPGLAGYGEKGAGSSLYFVGTVRACVCGGCGQALGVLEEFKQVKQEIGGRRRRWFEDDAMELIVWYRADGACEGFQLCYPGPDQQELALTWWEARGYSHARVDAGDSRPDKNLTPVLIPAGAVPWAVLETQFASRSAGLEPALRDFVLTRLKMRAA